MTRSLILDTEALSSLAEPHTPRLDNMRVAIEAARRLNARDSNRDQWIGDTLKAPLRTLTVWNTDPKALGW